MSVMRSDKDSVAVFTKIVEVLDAISMNKMVNVSQLSKHLNLPRTTVHRLLTNLVAHDVLTKDHQPGVRLIMWARQALKTSGLREASVPVLQRLVDTYKETASIYVRVGSHRICLERRESPEMLRHTVVVGEPLPLHKGSGGRILLAWLDEELRSELWQEAIAHYNPGTHPLQPNWEAVVQQGWTVSTGERDALLGSVSAPVFYGNQDEVIGALCVSGPLNRIMALQVESLGMELQVGATEITQRMGGLTSLLD